MTRYDKMDEKLHRILCEANEAKDRLHRMSEELREAGYIRKADSAMTLVYKIEEWQNRR